MIRRRDTRTVWHTPAAVLAVLRDGARLAEWNPAFGMSSGDTQAVAGSEVRITVRGMPGTLTYEQVRRHRVSIRIRIPGLTEIGTWWLEGVPGGTRVTHDLLQNGPLARLIEVGTRDVARMRLERLNHRLESPEEHNP
ncbi:MAG: SRPBCC family protein [Nocardioides sp.]